MNSIEGWFESIHFLYHPSYGNIILKLIQKYDHLLHFFEALPEFLSMVYLSSFYQNKDFYNNECKAWLNNDGGFSEWYKRLQVGIINLQV